MVLISFALVVISIACFILGMIKPKLFSFMKNPNRIKTTLLSFGLMLLSIGMIVIASKTQSPEVVEVVDEVEVKEDQGSNTISEIESKLQKFSSSEAQNINDARERVVFINQSSNDLFHIVMGSDQSQAEAAEELLSEVQSFKINQMPTLRTIYIKEKNNELGEDYEVSSVLVQELKVQSPSLKTSLSKKTLHSQLEVELKLFEFKKVTYQHSSADTKKATYKLS